MFGNYIRISNVSLWYCCRFMLHNLRLTQVLLPDYSDIYRDTSLDFGKLCSAVMKRFVAKHLSTN